MCSRARLFTSSTKIGSKVEAGDFMWLRAFMPAGLLCRWPGTVSLSTLQRRQPTYGRWARRRSDLRRQAQSLRLQRGSRSRSRNSAIRSNLAAGLGKFRIMIVAYAFFKGRQDAGFAVIAHCDDKGKSVLFDIGVVERGKPRAFVVGERVKPGTGLLCGAFCRQSLCSKPIFQPNLDAQSARPGACLCWAERKARHKGVVQSRGSVVHGAKFQPDARVLRPRRNAQKLRHRRR